MRADGFTPIWVPILMLTLANHVTLGKSLDSLSLYFPICKMGLMIKVSPLQGCCECARQGPC